MRFLKQHRFKFIISFLVIVLMIVSFYMLWVHVPFSKNVNRLDTIRNEILQENEYVYQEYFNEYHSNQTYYILYVEKDEQKQYVVFDHKKEYMTSYIGDIVTKNDVKEEFVEKYQLEVTSIEIGYENEMFVYCLTYKGKDSLIYAFYGLDSGEFIKAYELR